MELKEKQREEMEILPIVLVITFFRDENGRIGQMTKVEELYSNIVGEKALNRILELSSKLGDVMLRELAQSEANRLLNKIMGDN